jgi:hypothetical protein
MLETLLHEKLHALFVLYACACGLDCYDKNHFDDHLGHTIEWLAAALSVEQETRKLFGWNLGMGREVSIANDMHFQEANYRMRLC